MAEPSRRTGLTASDVVAGFTVACVLVPQSLSYARLAGLPAYQGLFASALPPIVAAIFASSRHLQTGPVALTSLLTFGVLHSFVAAEATDYVAYAALLALVVGVVRIGLGWVRAGVIAYFISQPVLVGFATGAAILILASQLPALVGVVPPVDGVMGGVWWAATHPSSWNGSAIALSLVTISLVGFGRRLHELFPGALVALAIGIAASVLFDVGGPVVGDVPSGFPPLSLRLPWTEAGALLVPGVIIALVGFAEPAAIARTFAAQDRESWDPDRELIGQGAANIAAGISGGFPVGGSFSRSAIARLAGAKSRWTGAITGLLVLAFLPFATVLEPLPLAVLGAIVVAGVAKLVRIGELSELHRFSRPQALVGWTTFVLTVMLAPRIDQALLVGIGGSIVVHLWRELHLEVRASFNDGTLRLEPIGVLYFASTPALDDVLIRELAAHPTASRLILDLEQVGRIDYTGALSLQNIVEEAKRAGLDVEFAGVPPQAQRLLTRVLGHAPSGTVEG